MLQVAVADDDADLRTAMAEALRDQGLDVVEAANGATLLAALQRGEFALVIADLLMPGLQGTDVLVLRRALRDDTPFVIVTAAPALLVEAVLELDRVQLLRKPFPIEDLLAAVRDALGVELPIGSVLATGTSPALTAHTEPGATVEATLVNETERPGSEPPES